MEKVQGEEIGFNQEKLNEALTRVKTTFEINLDELPKEGFAKITFDGRDIFIDAKDLKKTFLGGFKNGKDPKTGNLLFSKEECEKYGIETVSETLHIKDDIELLTQTGHFPRNATRLFENTVICMKSVDKADFEELRKKYVAKAKELGVNSDVIDEFNEQIESVKNMFFGGSSK